MNKYSIGKNIKIIEGFHDKLEETEGLFRGQSDWYKEMKNSLDNLTKQANATSENATNRLKWSGILR